MTKLKHTLGFWEVVQPTEGSNRLITVVERHGDNKIYRPKIANTYSQCPSGNDEEELANARLIAAAPEMLWALQLVNNLMLSGDGTLDPETIVAVDTAIRKATGQKPLWSIDCETDSE